MDRLARANFMEQHTTHVVTESDRRHRPQQAAAMFGFGRRSGGGKDGGGRGGDRPRNEEDDLLKVCVCEWEGSYGFDHVNHSSPKSDPR